MYTKIHKWNKWKNSRNLVTFVTGCVLPADREKFLMLFDLIFQISELLQFPEMLRQYGVVTPFSIDKGKPVEDQIRNRFTSVNFKTVLVDMERNHRWTTL